MNSNQTVELQDTSQSPITTNTSISQKLTQKVQETPEFANINENEIAFCSKIVQQIVDIGISEDDAIEFFLREDIDTSIFSLIEKYYQADERRNPDIMIENLKNSSEFKDVAKSFVRSVSTIGDVVERINPDIVIFPMRGAEPIHTALEKLNFLDNRRIVTPMIGTTFTSVSGKKLGEDGLRNIQLADDIEIAKDLWEDEFSSEICKKIIGKTAQNWNGRVVPPPTKLMTVVRKMVVLEGSLLEQIQNLKNDGTEKIAIVDEVVSGGTMSHVALALKLILHKHGLDQVNINLVSFQHDEFLDDRNRRAKSYHENIKGKDVGVTVDEVMGNFFTIDIRALLPALFILQSDKLEGEITSLSVIPNQKAKQFISDLIDTYQQDQTQ